MAEHGKYCPIMVAGGNTHVSQCIGKDCAWWLPYANDCALPVVAGGWLTAQFARMYLKRRVMRMAKFKKFVSTFCSYGKRREGGNDNVPD